LKHFTIAYKDEEDNFFEICEYAERSDEAIKNAISDIPTLKKNNDFIFRCTNESDLEWLLKFENLNKNELDRNSLNKKGIFILKEIKDYINDVFYFLKDSFKSAVDQ
tara:strand:- start:2378 stop:2698 length:321 start_codon:yes stop_codon:yes gene_type:complete